MPLTAASILTRVVDTLQDTTNVRWTTPELVRYLNDGRREVLLQRPDAYSRNEQFTAAVGTRQRLTTLNPSAAKLIDVVRNVASGKAVRLVNREILDSQLPGWHNIASTTDAVHFMYDPRDPLTFYVYPPAASGAKYDVVYAAYPAEMPEPATNVAVSTLTGASYALVLDDIYGNCLQDYVLYRAYMKDSEYAGNAGRATAHYSAFANALGIEIKATVAVQPMSRGNPNTMPVA